MLPTRLMKLEYVETIKDPSFITKDPYIPSLLNTSVTSHDTLNNRACRHTQLNGVIQYNGHLKGNPVRDEWNIETSKNLFSFTLHLVYKLLKIPRSDHYRH